MRDSGKTQTISALLTIGEVAETLRISQRLIWKMVQRQRFPKALRIGRAVRWRRSDINDFVQRGCQLESPRAAEGGER